jgi:hypothetical protein
VDGSSADALYQLPPGVNDPSALSNQMPAGFKAFTQGISTNTGVGAFFPSPKFMGSRPGYYFSVGGLGLGYYLDNNGNPNLLQEAKSKIRNSSSSSSSASTEVKRRPPPKGAPPKWALEGKSVAPTAP